MPQPLEIGEPAFAWRDHSKFVEVVPVRTGWLVVWGRYEEMGKRRLTLGNRVYRDVAGVKRRVVDAVMELTHNQQEAIDALGYLNAKGLPEHSPAALPAPL